MKTVHNRPIGENSPNLVTLTNNEAATNGCKKIALSCSMALLGFSVARLDLLDAFFDPWVHMFLEKYRPTILTHFC
jgi:hypothetical protein